MENKTDITFILPVLNRRSCIQRAVDSCLNCLSETIEPYVIVIDGESDDGTFEHLKECYGGDQRVTVIQNRREAGFMDACFIGVSLLKTAYATFMYSDDVLSPYFYQMVKTMSENRSVAIAFGYGKQAAEEQLLEFSPIMNFKIVPTEKVILSYYGRADLLENRSLPVNPVCCVVHSAILKEWMANVKEFVHGNQLRQYAMMKLCGGQDLMVYLTALMQFTDHALLSQGIVAQLTATKKSITKSGNREVQLLVGYWLARIWGVNQLLSDKKIRQAGMCTGYILAVWFYIMLLKIKKREFQWVLDITREMTASLFMIIKHRQLFKTLLSASRCIIVRYRISA